MNKRLNSIVDLNKYPIHDLESPTIKKLIERCKDDLDKHSCSTVPNFILPKSLKIAGQELEKQLMKFICLKKALILIYMLKMILH